MSWILQRYRLTEKAWVDADGQRGLRGIRFSILVKKTGNSNKKNHGMNFSMKGIATSWLSLLNVFVLGP